MPMEFLQLFRRPLPTRWSATYKQRRLGIFDCLDDALNAIAKENKGQDGMTLEVLLLAYDEQRFQEIEQRFSCFGCDEWIVVRMG